jgi:UDP-N-acetylmuramyl pentapeptide synthase
LRQKEKAKKLRKILKIPGEFNISNALAALATVARVLKIPDKISFQSPFSVQRNLAPLRREKNKNLQFAICNHQ